MASCSLGEIENARLKKLEDDLSLDQAILQDVAAKDGRPALRKQAVAYVMGHYCIFNVGPARCSSNCRAARCTTYLFVTPDQNCDIA